LLERVCREVWRECDGVTSVAAIAAALRKDERAIWLALHQLTKAQLLAEVVSFPPDMSAAKSRREIAECLGLGAAAFVTSIVARRALYRGPSVLFFAVLRFSLRTSVKD
jgi:hypothetical protein